MCLIKLGDQYSVPPTSENIKILNEIFNTDKISLGSNNERALLDFERPLAEIIEKIEALQLHQMKIQTIRSN